MHERQAITRPGDGRKGFVDMNDNRDQDPRHRDAAATRLSQLYRETARETAPAKLDDEVLDSARRAVRDRPAWAWLKPVALAAGVVLCFGVVLQLNRPAPQASLAVERTQAMELHRAATESRAQKMGEGQRAKSAETSSCADEARVQVATWQSCIDELREAGAHDLAEAEAEQLEATFPAAGVPVH